MLLFLSVLFLLVVSAAIRVLKEAAVAVFFWLWYLNLERAAEAPLFQHRACDSNSNELILSRWLWERGEKGGASLQKQARVRALCGVMQ
jgi:hypothetical protein